MAKVKLNEEMKKVVAMFKADKWDGEIIPISPDMIRVYRKGVFDGLGAIIKPEIDCTVHYEEVPGELTPNLIVTKKARAVWELDVVDLVRNNVKW